MALRIMGNRKSGTAVPSNLGDSRVGAGVFHPEVEKTPEDLANALGN